MTKREKELRERLQKRLDEAEAAADAAAGADGRIGHGRIGHLSAANAEFVAALAEDVFMALAVAKRADYLGHLNEILCFIGAAGKAASK